MKATRISNAGVRSRIKQLLILLVAIVIGVLISQAAEAQQYPDSGNAHSCLNDVNK